MKSRSTFDALVFLHSILLVNKIIITNKLCCHRTFVPGTLLGSAVPKFTKAGNAACVGCANLTVLCDSFILPYGQSNLERISGIIRERRCLPVIFPAEALGEAYGPVGEQEEIANEVCGSSIPVNKALVYLMLHQLEHTHSVLIKTVLFTKPTNWKKLFLYYLRGRSLLKKFSVATCFCQGSTWNRKARDFVQGRGVAT